MARELIDDDRKYDEATIDTHPPAMQACRSCNASLQVLQARKLGQVQMSAKHIIYHAGSAKLLRSVFRGVAISFEDKLRSNLSLSAG